jgi:hypothetical protein
VEWETSTGEQLKDEVARLGGILLIMGILHALNVVALPVIGRLLSLNKQLDEDGTFGDPGPSRPSRPSPPSPTSVIPPLGPGSWIVRIEPTPDD